MAFLFTRNVHADYGGHGWISEWAELDETTTTPPWVVVGPFTDLTVQVMAIVSGTPTVGIEGSLNRPDDGTIIASRLSNPSQAAIALTTAGAMAKVLESPYMIRPRVVAGIGSATVRIKLSKMISGF